MGGRWLAFGTAGFATAVTLLMVLSPAGAGALVSPNTVLAPAYKHTVAAPSSYVDLYGCKEKANAALGTWNPTTGTVTGMDKSAARTCKAGINGIGGSSSGYATSGVEIGVPFKVNANGNHSIMAQWTITVASAASFFNTSCPAKNIHFPIPLNSYAYAYCEGAGQASIYLDSYVVDLNNNSWYNYNYSYVEVAIGSSYENYTDCYNYGTPTCYNYTYASGGYSYGYNEVGNVGFNWNGVNHVTMWTNSTMMVRSHHYALIVYWSVSADSYAESANLLGPYAAIGSASVNMATLGNGAVLHSITIH